MTQFELKRVFCDLFVCVCSCDRIYLSVMWYSSLYLATRDSQQEDVFKNAEKTFDMVLPRRTT